MDSNHRPPAYQADALTCWAISPLFGGDNRDRTDDPLLAKQVLSQLSYTPVVLLWVSIPFIQGSRKFADLKN